MFDACFDIFYTLLYITYINLMHKYIENLLPIFSRLQYLIPNYGLSLFWDLPKPMNNESSNTLELHCFMKSHSNACSINFQTCDAIMQYNHWTLNLNMQLFIQFVLVVWLMWQTTWQSWILFLCLKWHLAMIFCSWHSTYFWFFYNRICGNPPYLW